MSWLFSQALVAAYWPASCLAGAPSAPLNMTTTAPTFSRNGKTIKSSHLSRFGLTCELLTAGLGEDLLTSYLAASRAKISASQAKAQALQGHAAASGASSLALLMKSDPDLCSSRTAPCFALAVLSPCCKTLPVSGFMRDGIVYPLPKWEPTTSVTASGLWPTPTVTGNNNRAGLSAKSGNGLATAVKLWPTPVASNAKQGRREPDGKRGIDLVTATRLFPTPTASDAKGRSSAAFVQAWGVKKLSDVIQPRWPTPCAMEPVKNLQAYAQTLAQPRSQRGGGKGPNLATKVAMYPTPTASDATGWNATGWNAKTVAERKAAGSSVRLSNAALDTQGNPAGGQLNPTWEEWLMGWPTGWTELKPLAMDKFHAWRLEHGGC
jgi:hypothetical protein